MLRRLEPVSDRPVIGIPTAIEQARWGVWDSPVHLLPREYADAVRRAGGLAVLLPPDPELTGDPAQVLALLDGLLLAGGSDIDPATYGQERHPQTTGTSRERDDWELALCSAAIAADMPLLAVCRGMQVLNIERGGTLHQHLPDVTGHGEHRRTPGSFVGSDHSVRLAAGSLAAAAVGERERRTFSHHHQGVDAIGDGLVVSGGSDLDPVAEAVELPGRRFVLGVQWHPEVDASSRLIARLVDEARSYRAERQAG